MQDFARKQEGAKKCMQKIAKICLHEYADCNRYEKLVKASATFCRNLLFFYVLA
jgi:hypothetical protein